jgi:hypothetical protein
MYIQLNIYSILTQLSAIYKGYFLPTLVNLCLIMFGVTEPKTMPLGNKYD